MKKNLFEIEKGTNKIFVRGDRNNEFIKAYMDLPKEYRNELNKVLNVTLFDGYELSIFEMTEE